MRIALALILLAGCAENTVGAADDDLAAPNDLAVSFDSPPPPDMAVFTDLATLAASDLSAADLRKTGLFDGGIEAGCNPASCMTRTCGPSPCGYHCGACTGAAMACSNGTCGNCASFCTDDNGDHICPGNYGFRRCADGTVRNCICEGVPDVWLCTPTCP